MNEIARAEIPNAVASAGERLAPPIERVRLASVRSSPGSYLAFAFVLTFTAGLLLRAERDLAAMLVLALAWILTPLLAYTDRLSFDGETLSRNSLLLFVLRLFGGRVPALKLDEIERIETFAVRTLRRGGRVRYRYRSEVVGKGINLVFASGGEGYRSMVRTLFPLIAPEKLDTRSAELGEYLTHPKLLRQTIKVLKIAPVAVLDEATADFKHSSEKSIKNQRAVAELRRASDFERGRHLRRVANELRAAGRLREAAEAFRRALLVTPRDGWLVYEFARFLRSRASASGDAKLLNRSRAALRLASRRGADDALLLSRIGESFLENGNFVYAGRNFERALEINSRAFRAATGLAEIALRSGKLAHVIHQYNTAARIAPDESLARYAKREADYYALLNNDDEYLAGELSRIGWLDTLQRARKAAARLTFAGLLLALVAASVEETIASASWAIATSALIAWCALSLLHPWLAKRRAALAANNLD
jgi:tetratricopeptide (TPR) repeat protein